MSKQHALQTVFFFFSSLAFSLWGCYSAKISETEKQFFYISVVLMVFASFVFAKTLRDERIRKLYSNESLSMFIGGGYAYWLTVLGTWVFSVFFPFRSILNVKTQLDWSGELGFQLIALTFLLSSTLNVSKTVRDMSDSANFTDPTFLDREMQVLWVMLRI